MEIDALLCDAATVRERLLHVLGGGVSKLTRATYPAELGVDLAIVVTVTRTETEKPIPIEVAVRGGDVLLASISGHMQIELREFDHGTFPAVIVLRGIVLPAAGQYRIEIEVGSTLQRTLKLEAVVGDYQAPAASSPLTRTSESIT